MDMAFHTLVAAALLAASGRGLVPPATVSTPKRVVPKLSAKMMDAMACASPATAGGMFGIHAVQVSTGRVLYSHNAQNTFTPASNTKLFSTALALLQLSPTHRFVTRVAADREPDVNGVIMGDLSLVGGGDPTLGSRRFGQLFGTRTDAINDLAEAVVAKGIKHVRGSVIGDETFYPNDPYPIGWTIDDAIADYGAPVSALTIHDNVQLISASPWTFRFTPNTEYFTVFNQIRPGDESDVRVDRVRASRQLILTGTLPADRISTELVAVDQPALFAAMLLQDALIRRGVRIDGAPAVRSRRVGERLSPMPKVALAEHPSPPLLDILRVIDKVSQNLYSELVLREAGRVAAGEATRQAGLHELYAMVARMGAPAGCCYFQDGSGLSRQTLVTPQATTRLLLHMYRSEHRDVFLSLLPMGGVDGTLSNRFAGEEENAKRIRAKTGSLAHVSALSGYVSSKTYGEVAFSILLNHFNGESKDARSVIDKLALALAE
jgi:serine-type D-Ala-D-Ala carboxypeptidase/endopeptidase (penicillin-binding protein 4)